MGAKMMSVLLVAAALGTAACNTVRGAGQDVQSVANCTEDLMKQGKC
jgi:predicted small secreted protein